MDMVEMNCYSIAVSKIYIVLNEKSACTKNPGKYDLPPRRKRNSHLPGDPEILGNNCLRNPRPQKKKPK